jgi:diguanylate cyclase (GGDEF)-like protein/PAS domain S-box-containing protein
MTGPIPLRAVGAGSLVFLATAALAWYASWAIEDRARRETLALDSSAQASLQRRVQTELDKEIEALRLLAAKTASQTPGALDIQQTLSGHPGLLAVAWVEAAPNPAPNYEIRWTEPPLYEPAVRRLHELVSRNRAQLLRAAFTGKTPQTTEAIHVADRGNAFAAYAPGLASGQVKGAILGIYHAQILLDHVFERVLGQTYSLQLLDGNQAVYERGDRKTRAEDWEHQSRVQVFGSTWGLRLWPNPETYQARQSLRARVWWGGLLLASLLALLAGAMAWRRKPMPGAAQIPPVLRHLDDKLFVYQAALAAVEEPLLLIDVEPTSRGRVEWVSFGNEAFAKLLGVLPSAVSGKPLRSLLHSDSGADFMPRLKERLAGAEPFCLEIYFLRNDQQRVRAALSGKRIGAEAGGAAHWLCLFRATPALEEFEETARLVEAPPKPALLDTLLEHAPMPVIALDAAGNVTHSNAHAHKLLGMQASELESTPPPFALPDRPAARKQPLRVEATSKDGARLVLEVWAAPVAESKTLLLLADQTNTQVNIEDLAGREFLFRSLVESTSSILALIDAHSSIRYVNPALENTLGLDPSHLTGTQAKDLFPSASGGLGGRDSVPHRDGTLREFETLVQMVAGSDLRVLTAHPVPPGKDAVQPAWFLDAVPDVLLRFDNSHRIVWMNRAAEDLYAVSLAQATGKSLAELLPKWLQVPGRNQIWDALDREGTWQGEISSYTAQGREIVQDASITRIPGEDSEPQGFVGIYRDITGKKKAVESIASEETARTLNALGSSEALWDWNLRNGELYLSPRWKEMLGYGGAELGAELDATPETWWNLVHPSDLAPLRGKIQQHLKGQSEYLEAEYRARSKDGQYRWMLTRAMATRDASGEATRIVGLQSDIQEQKDSDEQLLFEAFHDSLTGLPNRALFVDRLSGQLAQSKTGYSILFCDLKSFAETNRILGPRGGDAALAEAARRIAAALPPKSFLARHGSDEFVAIVPVEGIEKHRALADLLAYQLAKPFVHAAKSVAFAASMGFVEASPASNAEELIAAASRAMLGQAQPASAHAPATDDIRLAITAGEFRVFYHPTITLETGEIAGVEALVRWQHPDRGLLTPKDFLAAAEASGAILELDRWVLREACAKAAELNLRFRRAETMVLTVNLSSQHFADESLTTRLEEVLADTAINPRYLRLELNEQSLGQVNGSPRMFENLNRLRVQLSVDDFDAVSGALPDFAHLSIDRVKLHANLVRGLATGRHVERVRELIGAAERRQVQVVAEGVETLEQLAVLRELKCHLAQGFYFTQPAPAQDTERLLARSPRW